MKQKQYQRPTTKVVKLQHTGMLMVSGGGESGSAGLQNYNVVDCEDE